MARPRVFISSTFYDLRHVRNDLELFVSRLGYEPVLNERGTIAYGTAAKLEEYAYHEVDRCDILVSIIGGRYGTESADGGYSISNNELKRALASDKQVYIFIESSVHAEYRTYLLNKSSPKMKYHFVDNVKVYRFIEEIYALPRNNTVAPFESTADITEYLQEQWAGLFQRYLADQRARSDRRVAEDLSATADTLRRVVASLAGEGGARDAKVRSILFDSHPVFSAIKLALNVPYRVFFTSLAELTQWLTAAVDFDHKVDEDAQDSPDFHEWLRSWEPPSDDREYELLKISSSLFDEEGALLPVDADTWDSGWVRLERRRGRGFSMDPVIEVPAPGADAVPD